MKALATGEPSATLGFGEATDCARKATSSDEAPASASADEAPAAANILSIREYLDGDVSGMGVTGILLFAAMPAAEAAIREASACNATVTAEASSCISVLLQGPSQPDDALRASGTAGGEAEGGWWPGDRGGWWPGDRHRDRDRDHDDRNRDRDHDEEPESASARVAHLFSIWLSKMK